MDPRDDAPRSRPPADELEDPVVAQARIDLRELTAGERVAQAIALSRTATRIAAAAETARRGAANDE
jgi:type VI protein secretion system component VasK